MDINRVAIIGLGALGILFGHQLTKKLPNSNVTFIADKERVKRYVTEGIYCNGERCNFDFVTPEAYHEPADLLIFTVKFSGLKEAIKAVKHYVADNTIILSALNGISSEAMIGETYGMDKMLYCVAQGMDAVKEGNELTYQNKGLLCFGEKEPNLVSEKVKRVARYFEKVKFPYEVDTNMVKRQWGKFMLNVGVNQTVAVYESNYYEIQQEGPAREMMIAAMKEVINLSEKEGIYLTETDLHYWLHVLATLNPEGKPSMRQDLEAMRYSEVDLFAGTVLKLGDKHGIPTPINKQLYETIYSIESKF